MKAQFSKLFEAARKTKIKITMKIIFTKNKVFFYTFGDSLKCAIAFVRNALISRYRGNFFRISSVSFN